MAAACVKATSSRYQGAVLLASVFLSAILLSHRTPAVSGARIQVLVFDDSDSINAESPPHTVSVEPVSSSVSVVRSPHLGRYRHREVEGPRSRRPPPHLDDDEGRRVPSEDGGEDNVLLLPSRDQQRMLYSLLPALLEALTANRHSAGTKGGEEDSSSSEEDGGEEQSETAPSGKANKGEEEGGEEDKEGGGEKEEDEEEPISEKAEGDKEESTSEKQGDEKKVKAGKEDEGKPTSGEKEEDKEKPTAEKEDKEQPKLDKKSDGKKPTFGKDSNRKIGKVDTEKKIEETKGNSTQNKELNGKSAKNNATDISGQDAKVADEMERHLSNDTKNGTVGMGEKQRDETQKTAQLLPDAAKNETTDEVVTKESGSDKQQVDGKIIVRHLTEKGKDETGGMKSAKRVVRRRKKKLHVGPPPPASTSTEKTEEATTETPSVPADVTEAAVAPIPDKPSDFPHPPSNPDITSKTAQAPAISNFLPLPQPVQPPPTNMFAVVTQPPRPVYDEGTMAAPVSRLAAPPPPPATPDVLKEDFPAPSGLLFVPPPPTPPPPPSYSTVATEKPMDYANGVVMHQHWKDYRPKTGYPTGRHLDDDNKGAGLSVPVGKGRYEVRQQTVLTPEVDLFSQYVIWVDGKQGGRKDAGQRPWRVDCNGDPNRFKFGFIIGLWDDGGLFKDVDKVKCAAGKKPFQLYEMDSVDSVRIDFWRPVRDFLAGNDGTVDCPPQYLLTGLYDDRYDFDGVKHGKCTRLRRAVVEYGECFYLSADRPGLGPSSDPYAPWHAECPASWALVGLRRDHERIRRVRCCPVYFDG